MSEEKARAEIAALEAEKAKADAERAKFEAERERVDREGRWTTLLSRFLVAAVATAATVLGYYKGVQEPRSQIVKAEMDLRMTSLTLERDQLQRERDAQARELQDATESVQSLEQRLDESAAALKQLTEECHEADVTKTVQRLRQEVAAAGAVVQQSRVKLESRAKRCELASYVSAGDRVTRAALQESDPESLVRLDLMCRAKGEASFTVGGYQVTCKCE